MLVLTLNGAILKKSYRVGCIDKNFAIGYTLGHMGGV